MPKIIGTGYMHSNCISIIIPTYNRAKKIARSIKSVLNQTYSNLEVIVVDDSSKDSTENVVSSFKDRRIRYIKLNQNQGACHARNIGIKNSKGEYIAFQDSDDEWSRVKLERQLKFLIDNRLDIVSCRMNRIFSNNNNIVFPNDISVNNENIYYENKISTQTILGKRKCFEDEKFDEQMPRFQDWDLILRIIKKYKLQIMDEILVNTYIQDKDRISQDPFKAVTAMKIMINKFSVNRKVESNFLKILANFEKLSGQRYRSDLLKALRKDPFNRKIILNCLLSFFPNDVQKKLRNYFSKV